MLHASTLNVFPLGGQTQTNKNWKGAAYITLTANNVHERAANLLPHHPTPRCEQTHAHSLENTPTTKSSHSLACCAVHVPGLQGRRDPPAMLEMHGSGGPTHPTRFPATAGESHGSRQHRPHSVRGSWRQESLDQGPTSKWNAASRRHAETTGRAAQLLPRAHAQPAGC